jgi:hypothetical protein
MDEVIATSKHRLSIMRSHRFPEIPVDRNGLQAMIDEIETNREIMKEVDRLIRERVQAREEHLMNWFKNRLAVIGCSIHNGEFDYYLKNDRAEKVLGLLHPVAAQNLNKFLDLINGKKSLEEVGNRG